LKRRSFITGAGAALASSSLSSVCSFSQALASRSARHRLPFNDVHYQRVRSYIEDEPIPEVDLVFQCQAGIHGRFYAKDSASQPITTPVEMSANTTVYFYRCKQFVGSALAPSVFCDDSQLARMENGRFFVAHVTAGKHSFHSNDAQAGVELDVRAGEKCFIRVVIATGMMKGHGRLLLTPSEQASYELKSKQLKPLDADKITDKDRVSWQETP
jgi:hypothetical protein